MKSIVNFLTWINENWTFIILILSLLLGIYKKISSYLKLANEQKIQKALDMVRPVILEKMFNAELDWSSIKKSGSLKKSQVISQLYSEFPILKDIVSQGKLIEGISDIIDSELTDLNTIIQKGGK